jgi:2-polyprenyl-3-methyl-5-hydroxy-6-metoxy-1,4-benzoquinol methylase
MPIGSFAILPHIMLAAQQKQPKTILDVGIGYGIYGPAFRQWLDMGVKPYKTIIDGVEGFAGYKSAAWREYDCVIVQDIAHIELPFKYDLIVFSDVIEHFDKLEGAHIVSKLKNLLNPGGILFIGTPAIWLAQTDVHGNELERHRSLWTIDDFPGCEVILDGTPFLGNQMILVKYTNPE